MKTREALLKEFEEEPTAKKFSKSDKVIHFTPAELKQILDAPTKAQTICGYCHDELGVPKSRKECVHDVKAIGKDVYKESYLNDIKYCDVCGRKLGE
ncbi:hypothetical protein FC89_GL000296 [Liquorilactobacillus ghanensis DSM 18630]|uniref:Uncharacterized protein n=1 Tax=Liquorilactobacillus ghanensis DSM 18630 TaxID=1423750 RepID=A0A0R1VSY9_9LACO|nr:hypothetical protein [Liquorilactobacillus ghanensis]KRM06987.1 hypothetical protein FC89_GL000296 [Liquorilactobacillus ghanensis DSM 18630]